MRTCFAAAIVAMSLGCSNENSAARALMDPGLNIKIQNAIRGSLPKEWVFVCVANSENGVFDSMGEHRDAERFARFDCTYNFAQDTGVVYVKFNEAEKFKEDTLFTVLTVNFNNNRQVRVFPSTLGPRLSTRNENSLIALSHEFFNAVRAPAN